MDKHLIQAGLKDPKILERLKATRRGDNGALQRELEALKGDIKSLKTAVNQLIQTTNTLLETTATLQGKFATRDPQPKKKATKATTTKMDKT